MPKFRAELSKKNDFWIPKERYYELKWFCMQYPGWIKIRNKLSTTIRSKSLVSPVGTSTGHTDDTANNAMVLSFLDKRIDMVENAIHSVADEIYSALLMGVTEGVSYDIISLKIDVPCGKEYYYKKYREFFAVLDMVRL